MRVVYQGEPGAYSEAAAHVFLPDARPRGLTTFHEVFEAVASGRAERGVVPVENSIGGSVGEVIDGLFDVRGIHVVAEHWMPIAHALVAPEDTALEDVREIRSHPQALRQCAASLRTLVPEASLVTAFDTAGAARQIAEAKPPGVAAVTSRAAAERYGLAVLAVDVASDAANVTRFLLLAPEGVASTRGGAMKTTLVLEPRVGVPNALFRSLTAFVGRRLAVHRIEQRPRLGQPGAYRYLLDVDGDAATETLKSAFEDLGTLCDEVRVVGSYAAAVIPSRD